MTDNKGILPKDILADNIDSKEINGLNVRKGTIAAVLANIDILESSSSSTQLKQTALKTIKDLVPSLIALGLHKHVTWNNLHVQSLINEAIKDTPNTK